MHSTPMMVESMSAISSRFRRPSAGTRLASHPGTASPSGAGPAKAISTADAASRVRLPVQRPRGLGRDRVGDPRRGGQDEDAGRQAQTAARRACRRWCSMPATRKASSSACAALSRGSQAVW